MMQKSVYFFTLICLLFIHCGEVSGLFEFPKETSSMRLQQPKNNEYFVYSSPRRGLSNVLLEQKSTIDCTQRHEPNESDQRIFSSIPFEQWTRSITFGTESVERRKRLEQNLLSSQITIQNGSLSHAQLLDTLPNVETRFDSEVALKILKSSLHVYHMVCLEKGIDAEQCNYLLGRKELPEETDLYRSCKEVLRSRRDGHHSFRRLLPRNYKDGFHAMFPETRLPSPRTISSKALPPRAADISSQPFDDEHRNLALVQWAQFIEHDLSKPVVTSMSNGQPIECCNKENFNLLPRHRHSACAPLLGKDPTIKYGRENCLNYVRSALAVGGSCTFGAPEQLNQATGYFDLSQLYGFTKDAQTRMRSFKNGSIKSSPASKEGQELLPTASEESSDFCAFRNDSNKTFCFMAGDSRVNSNPFSIVIYSIFLRNHNLIARNLKAQHPDWSDEKLFQASKAVNVDIYRRIIFEEWLPEVLGSDIAQKVNTEFLSENKSSANPDSHISNEFAVAAIRFYFSMIPNALYNLDTITNAEGGSYSKVRNNDILPDPHIFVFRDQIYTPSLTYSSKKLDEILQSLLQQKSMKMDGTYVASLIPDAMGNIRPTHGDILAFDIQRGRDHGLQPYFRYAEECSGIKIKTWDNFSSLMTKENIYKLQSVYSNWTDVDLMAGGISETPAQGTVGPTFTCILGEQFSRIRQWQYLMGSTKTNTPLLESYKSVTAAYLLCLNSGLKYVQKNIFRMASDSNPLISCPNKSETTHFP